MKKRISFILALCMSLSLYIATPVAAAGFTDVSSSSWYYTAVSYVSSEGYMVGTSDTQFSPTATLTRAMFVTALYRMSSDYGTYAGVSTEFTDVKKNSWYADAVAWAVDQGITTGVTATTFEPMTAITREQMACFVDRYLVAYNIELTEVSSPTVSFADAYGTADWAKAALETMRLTGVISGDDTGYFRPHDTATRAEAATIFYRIYASLNGEDLSPTFPAKDACYYDCGVVWHTCYSEESHDYIEDCFSDGCPYCGCNDLSCGYFYVQNFSDGTIKIVRRGNCPQYDERLDEYKYCQTCHKKLGDGTNNTCAVVHLFGDQTCANCGVTYGAGKCHTCA